MRKILLSLGVAAVAVGALTSCGKSDKNVSAADQALGDSIATALGEFAAVQAQNQLAQMMAWNAVDSAKYSKADFLAGLKAVLDADTSKLAYFDGIRSGLQLIQPVTGISNNYDIPVNPEKLYEAFKKVYMQDSVADPNAYYMAYQEVMGKAQSRIQEIEMEKIRQSKEYKENGEAGKAYAEKMLGQGYTKSTSGIVYKIENPGEGEKVQPTDRVAIYYKGMKTDGEVFDQTQDKPYESSANVFVPGFNEALSMLGKGGKMTVVIPAELAYGDTGAGNAIGPNETLVFEIEVESITPRQQPVVSSKVDTSNLPKLSAKEPVAK